MTTYPHVKHKLTNTSFKTCKNYTGYTNDSMHIKGILNPESSIGVGTISEHIVTEVLQDCINYNQITFNSPYDLMSQQYGNINVKSSKIYKNNVFKFCKHRNASIPDYYICLGFDEYRTKIIKVFIIPGNASVVHNYGIFITNTSKGLSKVSQYETNCDPYNTIYQNLNLIDIREFQSLESS